MIGCARDESQFLHKGTTGRPLIEKPSTGSVWSEEVLSRGGPQEGRVPMRKTF